MEEGTPISPPGERLCNNAAKAAVNISTLRRITLLNFDYLFPTLDCDEDCRHIWSRTFAAV